jgi:hypothetical protein
MHGLQTIINTNKQLVEAKRIIEETKNKPDPLEKYLKEYLETRAKQCQ